MVHDRTGRRDGDDDAPDAVEAARALLPGEQLHLVRTLKSGERTTVHRVEAEAPDGGRRSLIVKRYHDGEEGWLRESAALVSVPGAVRVPAVVAGGADPAILVLEDLGDGPSIADDLLGDDADVAAASLDGWAEALAELHAATRDARSTFAAELARRAGPDPVAECWMPSRLREAERVLDRDCGALGVRIPTGALTELIGLGERLGGDTTAALTPADACPDNNVRIGSRRVLIDFEGAQWRHVAWDVAYLLVPWPTCWWAWRLPDEVAAAAVARYRTVAAQAFPEVADDVFAADLDAAAVGWALVSAAWSLDHALSSAVEIDQQLDPEHATPTRRALILHRLGLAARSTELPALGELAAGLRDELLRRWDDVPLDLAPAFRGR